MITIQYLAQNSSRKWNLTQYEPHRNCYKKIAKKTIKIGLQLVKNHDHKIINYNNMHTHIYQNIVTQ